MSFLNEEQRKRDESTVATFLIFLNIVLFGTFLLICFYQGLS